ncbi:hypothetical protein WJ542_07860 [Paraburkholderia sp. B3]|uniref:hypothetical protein n=1 Tax=Paraburkholderia sp. B3 TaxID=3134791 RepID=UPI003981F4C3
MNLVFRFLLVCAFALLGMRTATACGHEAPVSDGERVVAGAHALVKAACHEAHGACDADCCVVSCAMHCVLPTTGLCFDTEPGAGAQVVSLSEPLRAGITHAPPLPPPIV